MRYRWLGLLLVLIPLAAWAAPHPRVHGQATIFLPFVARSTALQPSLDLPLTYATHLGGAGADAGWAADVDGQRQVIWGGALSLDPFGLTPTNLLGGGTGAILRFNADSDTALSLTRIGGALVADPVVYDLEVVNNRLVVCGNWGVALLSADAQTLLWSANPGVVRRCALGSDGTVAAAVAPEVFVYNLGGTQVGSWSTGASTSDSESFDVAVYAPNATVIATGYKQYSNLQVAFLRAWTYAGAPVWTSYDFSASATSGAGLGADTRGRRVALGRDGKLYFTGRSDGGNNVFERNPLDINQAATIIKPDFYTNPYNNSAALTWYGRYSPANGALERGQFLVARLSSGKGNTLVPLSIAADLDGTVYLAGESYCCIDQRDSRTVAGVAVGPYAGGEGFIAVISADLTQRYIWTPLAGPGVSAGGSPLRAVAIHNGVMAVALTVNNGRLITTPNAVQPAPATLPDGYLGIWRR